MPVVVDMRIMGIDPGLQCTGYGLIDRLEDQQYRLIEGGVVPTDADQLLQHRLSTIFAGICEVMAEFEPDVAVVEKLYAKYSHPRTAIMMGHARGVIYLAGAQQAVPIRAYTASQVKKALVGNGRASKRQVAAMVCQTLGLSEPPTPADVTDALALAICHAHPLRVLGGPRKLPAAIEAALAREGRGANDT